MPSLISEIEEMSWKDQSKIFLHISEKYIHRLQDDKWTYKSCRNLLDICWRYLKHNKAEFTAFDNYLEFDSENYIPDNSKYWVFLKNGKPKFPYQAWPLIEIIKTTSFIAQHYALSPQGKIEGAKRIEEGETAGNSYTGNIILDMPLDAAYQGGLLDPEIFQQFDISLSEYNLTEESKSWG